MASLAKMAAEKLQDDSCMNEIESYGKRFVAFRTSRAGFHVAFLFNSAKIHSHAFPTTCLNRAIRPLHKFRLACHSHNKIVEVREQAFTKGVRYDAQCGWN